MKKSFIILTSLLLTCIMLIGCAETDTTISTSKELNKNLNILTNTINRMDTVDNQYLVSSDLFSLNTISNKNISNRKSYSNILANSYNVVIEAEEIKNKKDLNETLQKTLKEEIINRLYCDEDGNCKICKDVFTCNEDGTCNSCKQTIICDENGNCNNCGIELTTNTDNNCTNCNQSYISNSCNPNMSLSTKEALMKTPIK